MKKNLTFIALLGLSTLVHAQTWNTAGNTLSGTAPTPTQFLGSTSGTYDLIFKSGSATERMRLSTTGNLGIGTTGTPAFPLQVKKDQAAYTYIASDNAGTVGNGTGSGFAVTENNAVAWYMRGERDGSGRFSIGTPTATRLTINNAGNVGIGSPAPVSKLDLGTNYSDPSAYPNKITLWSNGANNYFGFGVSTGSLDYFTQNKHRFFTGYAGSAGTQKMVLDENGNLGIGTPTPNSKLEVNGIISSTNPSPTIKGGYKFPDGTIQTTSASGKGDILWTPVEAYGAKGDGLTDDRAAIQAALDDPKHPQICLSPGKTYFVNGTLTIGYPPRTTWNHGPSLYIPASSVLLSNVYGGIAIILSNSAQLTGDGKIQMNAGTWGHNSTGILINGSMNKIDIGTIEGFDYGIFFNGDVDNAVGYNNVNVRFLHNNLNSIYMKVDHDPAPAKADAGWVNQNYIHFDKILVDGGNYPASQAIGINMSASRSLPNGNTFSGCIEGLSTGLILIGAYNRFEGLRLENCTKKVIVYDSPTELTRSNYFYGDFAADVTTPLGGFEFHLGGGSKGANTEYNAVSLFGWGESTYLNQLYSAGTYNFSDSRYKKDIKKLEGALDKVMALKGSSYKMKVASGKDKDKKEYGFIAQELKEVLPELVVTNPVDGMYAVNYIGVIPFLVEAMKEQQKKIDSLKAKTETPKDSALVDAVKKQQKKIDSLEAKINTPQDSSLAEALKNQQKKIDALEAKLNSKDKDKQEVLNDLKNQIEYCCSKNENNNPKALSSSSDPINSANNIAKLEQNQPNPFSGATEIKYFIPSETTSAFINIYNLNGTQIKSYPINEKGKGSILIYGTDLGPGMYIYNLVINGYEMDSKKMTLIN